MTNKKLYIETYGCQMNVADSEVVISLLNEKGYQITDNIADADLILVNTCSVRENAEIRVRGRLQVFNQQKKKNPGLIIGVIGCMAERLKEELLEQEKMVDIVVGPDNYRDLPKLINKAEYGQKSINVALSADETYGDIKPVHVLSNNVSAFISIMRGCENMCTYCIVPYVRGVERSRDPETIVNEAKELFNKGYKEITLLGQNVNSYNWQNENERINFSLLLEMLATVNPDLRIRFATSHPKDLNAGVLNVMAKYENVCKSIHLPVQNGSNRILEKMNRKYTREWYLEKINLIKTIVPGCSISTDIMVGFPGETEEDHLQTLDLMRKVKFDFAYMFKYSVRPKTYAARKFKDDVPEDVKILRLNQVIKLQSELSHESNKKDIGKVFKVLAEGHSKKSKTELFGRNSQNKVVIFPEGNVKPGDYVNVKIEKCTSATLIGSVIN
ncbi:MAG: tRNA (N6-isopentenyl adenosine(37)-C2)-methylthiotransferase MiaB [Marinilabiliales bacterium]